MDLGYLKLQNGSDIRGISVAGVCGEEVNFNQAKAFYIAKAFVAFVAKKTGKKEEEIRIAIGHDSRISAEDIKIGANAGMLSAKAQVTDCHLSTTPAMFMATVLPNWEYDGAIMLTASHLPYNRNGMKFFTPEGGLEKADISWILQRAQEENEECFARATAVKDGKTLSEEQIETALQDGKDRLFEADLLSAYSAHLRGIIKENVKAQNYEKPLEGLHIVVDSGNGATGFFAKQVLQELGADTTGSQFLEPDGMFPNHIPNPENAQAMKAISEATLACQADLGIIFDTDGDRASAVFADGREISRNAFVALMSAIVAKEHPNTTVVTDSVTSDEFADFVKGTLGMHHHRFKRGYKNVINEAIRLNKEGVETHLAMETSGHGALKENYFLDDGAYLCVKMICELACCKKEGRRFEDLLSGLQYPEESKEFRMKIRIDDFSNYGDLILNELMEYASWQTDFAIAKDSYEGIRVSVNNCKVKGWFLLRKSLHDPLMPMNIEAKNKGGVYVIVQRLLPFFEQCDYLDTMPLLDYLEENRNNI